MDRRRYLTGIAGVTAGLAGCSGLLGGGGDGDGNGDGNGNENGPEAAYRAFWQAADDGDRERVEELIHPNARGVSEPPEGFTDADVEVGDTDVVEREGDRAIVVGELTFQAETGETEGPIGFDLEFRPHDGEWKYYHGMDWGA